jgi:hypothetical protein
MSATDCHMKKTVNVPTAAWFEFGHPVNIMTKQQPDLIRATGFTGG